jgi:GH3 auxin-responsive promoter
VLDVTPLLRAYTRRRAAMLAAQNPVETQRTALLRLVRRARNTRFGQDHGFDRIRDISDFQRRVPLRRYEDFWREYWQPALPRLASISWPDTIPYFALTSGTTSGKTKYIPVSTEMNASNRGAVLDLFTWHLQACADSRLLGGRNFMLGGSTALNELAPGIWAGDLSGIAARETPLWARPWSFPPPKLALLSDWEEKIDCLARLSLAADIRSLSGTPSWVLLFFDQLAALRPDQPAHIANWYPRLELFIHGGVDFAPYLRRFETFFAGSRAEMREVYPASEGFIAIADRSYGEGLRMILDRGLFYEFVPFEEVDSRAPTRHWLATAEPGVNYALVLSSNAGLFAYVLGDTVRLISRHPPRLLVTGRLSYTLSAFGEHLIGEEIERAVAYAATEIGASVTDYMVGPVFPDAANQRGGHRYVIECAVAPSAQALARFVAALDTNLSQQNADYRDHRAGGFGMKPPEVILAAPGSFAQWMRARGAMGGQHKVPRVSPDGAVLHELVVFLKQAQPRGD